MSNQQKKLTLIYTRTENPKNTKHGTMDGFFTDVDWDEIEKELEDPFLALRDMMNIHEGKS